MRALRRLLVLAIIIAIGAVGYLLARERLFAPTSKAAAPTTQIVAATKGNLQKTLTLTGSLEATQNESLAFTKMTGTAPLRTLNVKQGATVKAGDVLATIDAASYQTALDEARAALETARTKLATLKTPASADDITQAGLAVARAEANLAKARKALADLQSAALSDLQDAVANAKDDLALSLINQQLVEHSANAKTERDLTYAVSWYERRIADLEALVAQGKANLEQTQSVATETEALGKARSDLARVQASLSLARQAAAADVARAQQALADAQDVLADAAAGGNELAVAKAQVAIEEAQVALTVATDSRDALVAGASATDIAAAQADIDARTLAVAKAEEALAGCRLVAPFDGTIIRVATSAGSLIGSSTSIVQLANLKTMQVNATVDELTIRQLKEGQDATITFDAFAGQTFRGKVLSVPLDGALQNNVMIYNVPLSLSGAENVSLLIGMTANVRVTVAQARDAVLVPAIALLRSGDKYQVLMPITDDPAGETKTVDVTVGVNDGVNAQVLSGLNAGDKVVVRYAAVTRTIVNRQQGSNLFSRFSNMFR